MLRIKSKPMQHWLRLGLFVVLIGGVVACKKDDDKDEPAPQPTVREMLVGDGNKRWFIRQYGEVGLPKNVDATTLNNTRATLKPQPACDQDDAIILRIDGRVTLWHGEIPCEPTDPKNTLQESQITWRLIDDATLEFKEGNEVEVNKIMGITANRLHLRWIYTGVDSLYVIEQVFANP